MKNSNIEIVRALIKEINAQYNEASFTKKFDNNPKLKGKQTDLPDELQSQIVGEEDHSSEADKKIDTSELEMLKKMYKRTPTDKIKAMIDKLEAKLGVKENRKAESGKLEVTVYNRVGKQIKIVSKTLVGETEHVSVVEVPSGNIVFNSEGMMEAAPVEQDPYGNRPKPKATKDKHPAGTPGMTEGHEGQDHEVSMANNSLDSILWAVGELKKHLGDQERDIPAWIQDHITNAENFITQAAKNFHDYGAEEPSDDMSLAAMSPEELNEMIKKVGSKYNVYSKKGKKLGSHPSKKKAQKQMAAIEISKQGK